MNATRNIVINKVGPAHSLKVSTASESEAIDADHVTVNVQYSGINFADIQMRLGLYPDAPKKPFVPGYEVSGVVERIGADVTGLAVGDRVIAGTYFGGYASKVTVPAQQILPLPDDLSLADGAALPVSFFTAHLALFEMARVRSGDRVLIECATGGVGTLAVQMAKHAGAHVLGLTTSESKLDYIRAMGAEAMTRAAFDNDPKVRDFDFVLNASGGSSIAKQKSRLNMTGRMVCMGLNSGTKDGKRNIFRVALAALRTPRLGIFQLMNDNAGVFGLNALKVLESDDWVRRLATAFQESHALDLKPHVDRIFPAEQVADAHIYLQTKQARGKLLLAW
jgi:2-desacetyl-2-hydroxyethyl bacteriochlorophyllide A dehydrogenase